MFAKLDSSDKRIVIASVGVMIGGVVSIIDSWGVGGILGGLAGLGAAYVVLQPQLAPAMKMPAPKPTLLLGLGGVAAIGFILSALQWFEYFTNIARVYTLLFDVGLVSAIVLAYFAWMGYQADKGPAAPPPPPPPAA
jgi:hypothetical protein